MKLQKLHTGLLSIVLIIGAGCVHFEEIIEIKENNTGSFQYNLSIPVDIYQSVKSKNIENNPYSIFQFFDPKLGSNYFASESSLSLDRYRVYERKDRIYAKINGTISNLRNALDSKKLGNFSLITGSEDNLSILGLRLVDNSNFFQINNDTAKKEKIKELLEGAILSLKIIVPNKIVDTSGKVKSKKTVLWVFDTNKNDDFLKTKPDIFLSFK